MAEQVQITEAALLNAIEALEEGAEKEYQRKIYNKPADEVFFGAIQQMGEHIDALANAICRAMGD